MQGLAGIGKWLLSGSKWALGIVGGGYIANRVVPGAVQNTASDAAEAGVEIQSGAQAQNGNIDSFFAGRNKLQGIIGLLSGLFAAIAKATGSQTMANWSKGLADFRADEQAVIQNEIRRMGETSISNPAATQNPILSTLTGGQTPGGGLSDLAVTAIGAGTGAALVGGVPLAVAAGRKAFAGRTTSGGTTPTTGVQVADDAARATTAVADDAARGFTSVADDAARMLTPLELSQASKGVAGLSDDAARAGLSVADDAARVGMSLGGKGKIVAAAAVGLGAAYSWITGENPVVGTAQAAVDPTTPVDTTTTPSATSDLATGAPIEASLIAGSGAVVAASSLGVRAIPLLGGVVTGVDTLWNTGSYLFQGEWEKAGTELVAGAGLTLGATGGFLTYGLGETWHAGVRDGAMAVMGEDAEIGKAPLRTVLEMATGVNTDMVTVEHTSATPTPEYDTMGNVTGYTTSDATAAMDFGVPADTSRPSPSSTVEEFKSAIANSEIRVPETMEYAAMGYTPISAESGLTGDFGAAHDNKDRTATTPAFMFGRTGKGRKHDDRHLEV